MGPITGEGISYSLSLNANNFKVVREIVGVVGDTRHKGLDSEPRTEIFLPNLQEPYRCKSTYQA